MHERRRHRCYRHTSSVRAMPPYEDRGCTAALRRGVSSQGSARHAHSRRARTATAPLRPVVEEVCRAYAPRISAPAAPAPNATTRHPPVQEHRAHTGTVNRKRSVVVRMHQACEGRDHSPQIHCRVRRAALPPTSRRPARGGMVFTAGRFLGCARRKGRHIAGRRQLHFRCAGVGACMPEARFVPAQRLGRRPPAGAHFFGIRKTAEMHSVSSMPDGKRCVGHLEGSARGTTRHRQDHQ